MSNRTTSSLSRSDKAALALIGVLAIGRDGGYTAEVTRKAQSICDISLNSNEVKDALEQNEDVLIHEQEERGENCNMHKWTPKDMGELRKRIIEYLTNPIIQRSSILSLEKIEEKIGTIHSVA